MDGTAILIAQHFTKDAMGIWQEPEETQREIFVTVQSVSRAEFFQAAQAGNRCDLVLVTSALDYEGETIVEWMGKRYLIYRTYRQNGGDMIELYAEERVGITDGSQQAADQD